MPAIYVLDVPEFVALANISRDQLNYKVTNVGLGYIRVEAPDELVFERRKLGFKPAVWYSAFTGGIEGKIIEFGRDVVRVVSDDAQ